MTIDDHPTLEMRFFRLQCVDAINRHLSGFGIEWDDAIMAVKHVRGNLVGRQQPPTLDASVIALAYELLELANQCRREEDLSHRGAVETLDWITRWAIAEQNGPLSSPKSRHFQSYGG